MTNWRDMSSLGSLASKVGQTALSQVLNPLESIIKNLLDVDQQEEREMEMEEDLRAVCSIGPKRRPSILHTPLPSIDSAPEPSLMDQSMDQEKWKERATKHKLMSDWMERRAKKR